MVMGKAQHSISTIKTNLVPHMAEDAAKAQLL